MKTLFLFFSLLIITSACNSSKEKKQMNEDDSKNLTVDSTMNKETINDTITSDGTFILLGPANRKGLQMEAFQSWYKPGYDDYEVDMATVEKLKPLLKDSKITVFMGTWCEDSQRETPHFYKIMDSVGFNESNLNLITVSEEKTTPSGLEKGKNITNVPTFIIMKDDKELGRIVEYPIESLEKDMLAILSGKEYKHAYAE